MMSEVNLNETFEETMDDATVITVPIDDTLSNSGEAADAAAVGAALALKADLSQVTGISVNGENPDAQGAILLDASEIPMTDEAGADSVADAIDAAMERTAEDIAMGTEDETTIAEAIENTVKIISQELTEEEREQARQNIEAVTTDDFFVQFGSSSKTLTQNLTDEWATAVPEGHPVFVTISAQYGAYYGYLCRYSTNYGSGVVTRYNGNAHAVFMNAGTITVKTISAS